MDIIKELGLNVLHVDASKPYEIRYEDVVLVSDLRAAIDKLPVVYSAPDKNAKLWGNECEKGDTHKARLIGVEKLVKEPRVVEFNWTNKNAYSEWPHNVMLNSESTWKIVATEVIE